jgi:hypothetical protein
MEILGIFTIGVNPTTPLVKIPRRNTSQKISRLIPFPHIVETSLAGRLLPGDELFDLP